MWLSQMGSKIHETLGLNILLIWSSDLGILVLGADIMHLAAEANSRVDPRDAAMMLEAGGSGSAGRGPTEPSHD